jgi:S1-C subfamily serine protease
MRIIEKINLILAVIAVSLAVVVVGVSTMPEKSPRQIDVAREVVAPHVEAFRILSRDNQRFATGFHINFLGKVYLMTNRHVCDANVQLVNPTYAQFGLKLHKILFIDTEHDLCLLDSDSKTGLTIAAEDVPNLAPVFLVGHPRGEPLTIREGRKMDEGAFAADWLDGRTVTFGQISTITYGGNSGSPVTNTKGEVIGVLFAGDRRFVTEGYYVPLRYVRSFLMRVLLNFPPMETK